MMRVYFITDTQHHGKKNNPRKKAPTALAENPGHQYIIVSCRYGRFSSLYGIEGEIDLTDLFSILAKELNNKISHLEDDILGSDIAIQDYRHGNWGHLVNEENYPTRYRPKPVKGKNAIIIPVARKVLG